MSNPLAVFRKNQKVWMAALVFLAILAFIVLPNFESANSSAGGRNAEAQAVAVSWNNGQLTRAEVESSFRKHVDFVRFLQELAQKVIDAGGMPRVPGFAYDEQSKTISGLGIGQARSEGEVIQTRLMADYAQQQGVRLTDEVADEFIKEFCDGRVSSNDFNKLLRDNFSGSLTAFDIREQLKTQLAAILAGQMARGGLLAEPPGKTFADFEKLNKTAKIEAFPVFVDNFLPKVQGEPTETEIQSIFESGSRRFQNNGTGEPGFVRPYKSEFEYVQASMDKAIEAAKAKVTEEQIKAEYDRRIALNQLQTPVDAEPAASSDKPESNTGGEGPGNEQSAAPESASTETASSEPATTGTTPTNSAEQPTTQGTTGTSEPTPATPDPAPATPSPAATDQGRLMRGKVQLVNFIQEQGEAETAASPQTAADNPLRDDAVAVAETATTEATAAEDSSEPNATPEQPATASTEETSATTGSGNESAAAEDSKAMRPKTLEEAREEIVLGLARDAALQDLDATMVELYEKVMRPYYSAQRKYNTLLQAGRKGDELGEAPIRPDLKKFAEEHNMIYGRTELVDANTLAKSDFGKSNVRPNETGVTGMVANLAIGPGIEKFWPYESSYFDQSALAEGRIPDFQQYVFWKVDDRNAFIPELADVRDEVVEAWKRQQAEKLAEEECGALVKKLSDAGNDPWEKLTAEERDLVIKSDPFPWMSRYGQNIMTTNIPKMEVVGDSFMRKVFQSNVNQFQFGICESHKLFYVFRPVEFGPQQSELLERFVADPLKSGPMGIARTEAEAQLGDWYNSVERALNVNWQIQYNQGQ